MLTRILKGSVPWLVMLLLAVDITSRFVKPLPTNFDVISFLEASLGIVIAGLAIVGAVVVVGTWNEYKAAKDEINRRLGQLGEAERTMINLGMLNDGKGSSVKNALEIAWERMQRHLKSLEEFQNQFDKLKK